MSRQKISLNTLSGPDSRDLSVRDPAVRIRVSAWFCQNPSEVPACYLGITRGRVRTFFLPVLPLYGFTKLYINPFLIIYLLPNFKLPVLVLFWGLEQKKTKFGFPQLPICFPVSLTWHYSSIMIADVAIFIHHDTTAIDLALFIHHDTKAIEVALFIYYYYYYYY
jgi:hypothetical protein